ncbi:Uncharacterised protein [Escherichia coli]|nr:Uncharacterised protein [Escherichia coli]
MDTTIKARKACIRAFMTKNSSSKTDPTAVKTSVNVVTTYLPFLITSMVLAHNTFQRLIDIHHQYIGFVRTRLLQRFKLRHQHLGFKEMAFARFRRLSITSKSPFR